MAKTKLNDEDRKRIVEERGYKLLKIDREKMKNRMFIFITIECSLGHKYTTTWSKFQQGCRCPYCNESKGEKEVERVLEKYNIFFTSQYKFNDCRNVNPLPFDFYLPQYNCCIEYDGAQHFEIVEHFGGLDGFISRVIRDTIKNEYCKKNNIKLIRIPYWDFNKIEDILKRELEL